MYQVDFTSKFKKDYKKAVKLGFEKAIDEIIERIANDEILEPKYQDHALSGDYKGCRECHIKPDLLLIYRKNKNLLVLTCLRIGSHSELF